MVERERIVFQPLAEVPLSVRLAALERILASDPHMPKRERARLRALAHKPGGASPCPPELAMEILV